MSIDVDKAGLAFIRGWEGLRLKPYRCPAGYRTIGIGHRIHPDEFYPDGQAITEEQALILLHRDCQAPLRAIRRHLPVALSQNQVNALVSFGINLGAAWLGKGSVYTAVLGRGDVPAALLRFCKARNAAGVLEVNPGLVRRRQAEGVLWNTP